MVGLSIGRCLLGQDCYFAYRFDVSDGAAGVETASAFRSTEPHMRERRPKTPPNRAAGRGFDAPGRRTALKARVALSQKQIDCRRKNKAPSVTSRGSNWVV